MLSLVSSSPHRKRMLQGADGRFTASSPAQSSFEPTLFVPFRALPRQTPTRRQRHLLDSPGLGLALVLGGKKSAIGRSHLRKVPKASLRSEERRVGKEW